MNDNERLRRLKQSFGTDSNKWPTHDSDELVKWNVRNIPPSSPETKTMHELQEELQQAKQTLHDQLNADIRTMYIISCEADVFQLRVRLERLRNQNEG